MLTEEERAHDFAMQVSKSIMDYFIKNNSNENQDSINVDVEEAIKTYNNVYDMMLASLKRNN
ncbi:hypothetical protein OZX65_03830 [Leuconostocaceae bacterium ESL0723]|nr:hypothetical protein OZX65_03830 [Leuconostocaceae bacterium ESL0723]